MAKRKITADNLAAILCYSDSSESNFDDSVEDKDWDPLLLSDEKNYEADEKDAAQDESDYEDEERDAAEDEKAIPATDDCVVVAFATNNNMENEELPSHDGDDNNIVKK